MASDPQLRRPWMVAVWPGMGHVAISAGFYLMAKLEMHLLAEFSPRELFDIEHVDVKGGLIRTAGLPRSRFFVWTDPAQKRDLVMFVGEAQPPRGKYPFCARLIEFAQRLGVERVFTFAAMATPMRPEQTPRVFGAATDAVALNELSRLKLEIVEDGQIGGLNGLLLGAAADAGLRGACLLGELPQIFSQLPYPKASLAVLQTFVALSGVPIDLDELAEQAAAADVQLGDWLERVQQALGGAESDETPESSLVESLETLETLETSGLTLGEKQRLEQLFAQSRNDRSKAYELKRELDRLGVFPEYEERFLDLFQKPEP